MTIIDLVCVVFVLLFLGFVFVCWQGRISTQSEHNRDIELANAGLQQEVQVITMTDCGEEFTVREVIWVPRKTVLVSEEQV